MNFLQQVLSVFRSWPRKQLYILAASLVVIVVTIGAFSLVKLNVATTQTQHSTSASRSPHPHATKPSTVTPSATEVAESVEEIVEGDSYFCEYSFEELGQYVTKQQEAQSVVDELQRQLDDARINLATLQSKIAELEKGPWTHNHIDEKTQQFVEGTIEQYERAVSSELPFYTNIVTTLEGQVAEEQAVLPAVPCVG